MRRRFHPRDLLLVGALLCVRWAAPAQAAPAVLPAALPTSADITDVVSKLDRAGRTAAGDVYIIHKYGANLALSKQDIAAFDMRYVDLSSRANGLLDAVVLCLHTEHCTAASSEAQDIRNDANAVLAQSQRFDRVVADVRSRQKTDISPTEFGSPIDVLLKIVRPLLPSVPDLIETLINDQRADRKGLIDWIEAHHWPNVSTAAAKGE